MNREELEKYIAKAYNVEADYPWEKSPSYKVFRHSDNKKWFALVMDIPKDRLGLMEAGMIDVVNLKCDSVMIGSLCSEQGIFPAYHMSKKCWISVALDGSISDEKVKMLLDMSFCATADKMKKCKKEK